MLGRYNSADKEELHDVSPDAERLADRLGADIKEVYIVCNTTVCFAKEDIICNFNKAVASII